MTIQGCRKVVCLLFLFFLFDEIGAQSLDTINAVPQKDLAGIAKKIFHLDTTSTDKRNRAGKVYISFIPAAGYTLASKLGAVLSTNYAFYTDQEHSNLSVIKFIPEYTLIGQLILPLKVNLWTPANKFNVTGDFRYYISPQYTYGLGGHTSLINAQLLKYNYLAIREAILKKVARNFFVGLGYNIDYYWRIKEATVRGDGVAAYAAYGRLSRSFTSGPSLNLLLDDRKNSINPSQGFYGNIVFQPNFTFLGSTENWQSLLLDFRKYFKLNPASKNILGFWSYSWLTLGGNPSYLELPSTGWDAYYNLGRGYIQGRFKGRNLLYFETEYRFGITKNGLIGGVVFANVQTVSEWPSNRFEVLLPATGAGLRVKLNKVSNTNFAIDYGFGLNGSNGVFFSLGEVF